MHPSRSARPGPAAEGLRYSANTFEVISAGTQTTVQDFPVASATGGGRAAVRPDGQPRAAPGNALLGNPEDAAGLEITMSGPILRFNTDAVVAVTGAAIPVKLDDVAQPMNTAILIKAGSTLTIGTIAGAGARAYLAVRGGVQVPEYLGSKSTFTLGQFGGHGGRALRAGDVLHLAPLSNSSAGAGSPPSCAAPCRRCASCGDLRPARRAGILHRRLYRQVLRHRLGSALQLQPHRVRLIGPKPEWVRESGGEAGLHPSNIHDNPYAIGAVDFTGDMPVILGPDGPSLGGFVCPVTIIEADLWQLGQPAAGDKVRFVPVDVLTARQLAKAADAECASLAPAAVVATPVALQSPIVLDIGEADSRPSPASGDTHLLLEIGAPELTCCASVAMR